MNRQLKIGTIFMVIGLAILCLGLAPSWAALLGNWTFDSCDGTDSSGNGYNGTLVGDPECVAGAVGKSLELDGDFNAGDYVNVGTSPAFNLTTFSICAWIYPFTDAQGHILSKKGSFDFGLDSNQQLSMGIWIDGGHWVGNTPDHTIPANQRTCV
ncbi:MAG: LamG domain-containing protein [bacterium]|nr:LamG domain-containing protein [bacterium]